MSGIFPVDDIPGALPALRVNVVGTAPGAGGGATQTQVQAAIEAATNLDGIEGLLAANNTILNSVLTQLQGDRAITSKLFVDATGVTFLKVLLYNQTTNAMESANLAVNGTPYTPTSPETSIERSDMDTTETVWEIVVAGTGYSVGDTISQFLIVSQGPPITVAGVLWYNQNTGLALSSPPLTGHRRRIGAVSATEATLGLVQSGIGAVGDAAAASDTANVGLIALVKRQLQQLQVLLNRSPVVGQNTMANSTPVAIAADQSAIATTNVEIGGVADVAIPANNTAASSLKGLLRLIAGFLAPSTSSLAGSGIAPASDLACAARIKSIKLLNQSGIVVYMQIHNKAGALTTGDVPFTGLTYRISNATDVLYGLSDFGFFGRVFGVQANQRIALSSTFGTYTALTAPQLAQLALNVEVI